MRLAYPSEMRNKKQSRIGFNTIKRGGVEYGLTMKTWRD